MIELFVVGIIAALNMLIIKVKVEKGMILNAVLDFGIFLLFVKLSGGTLGGMVIATIGSLFISIALLVSPPKAMRSY